MKRNEAKEMKPFFICISRRDRQQVRASLFTDDGNENAGALLCGMSDGDHEYRLLVRKFCPVPAELYIARNEYHLEVSPHFYNSIIDDCIRERLSPVIIHSHPRHKDACYSPSDDSGEAKLLPVLESLLPKTTPASLVLTPHSLTGRRLVRGKFTPITGLKVFGLSSEIALFRGSEEFKITGIFDRQVRAFGAEGQRLIQSLKVGVVGVGGIGSLVVEQLARAGIANLALVDNDKIEESNLSRLLGAAKKDIDKSKAAVIGKHAQHLGVKKVTVISDSAIRQEVLNLLRDRDLIFSCVDNDRTRAILNRFSYQYLVPVVELGIRLDSREGNMRAAAGRVVIVGAGMTCLRCSHHLDPERIRAESLPKTERLLLQQEGYVMGIDEPVPAVISLNAVVAGLGVTAALNMFVKLTGGPQPVGQIYDATTGSVFTTNDVHEKGCDICDDVVGLKGLGDSQIVSAYT